MTTARIVTIDGEELVQALQREFSGTDGWVFAVGSVEQADIKFVGQGADRRRTVSARVTLSSFSGPVGGPYGVTLVRETHSGLELHGGLLLAARAIGVTASMIPGSVSESMLAARAAVTTVATDDDLEQLLPDVGDLVHHFAFGLSEVVMVSGDRLKIRDAVEPGRVREISIERLKVTGPTEEHGKRLFTLVRKG